MSKALTITQKKTSGNDIGHVNSSILVRTKGNRSIEVIYEKKNSVQSTAISLESQKPKVSRTSSYKQQKKEEEKEEEEEEEEENGKKKKSGTMGRGACWTADVEGRTSAWNNDWNTL